MNNDIFKTVTVEQFKEYFFRDFSFLPLYVEGQTYWTGDIVYYNNNFYKSIIDDNMTAPDNSENWQKVRGNVNDYVQDKDIERAMSQALSTANARFGIDDDDKIMIYLHLVAFYLQMDLNTASSSGGFVGITTSKSVGDVSEGFTIPQWVTDNPAFSIFTQNGFGLKYLSLILPYISCPILFSKGATTLD